MTNGNFTCTGWGEGEYNDEYNAIYTAPTPCMDGLRETRPDRWMLLKAHGTAVGLPSDADMVGQGSVATCGSFEPTLSVADFPAPVA